MANLFSSANYPSSEPTDVYVGDRWSWKKTDIVSDYNPSLYSLSYIFRSFTDANTSISITATNVNSEFVVEVPSATTAAYPHGTYRWYSFITRTSDSERIELNSGTIEVNPNRTIASDDPRSHAERMVNKIEAVLENRASADVMSYSIAGRSLSKMSPDELVKWRDYYLSEVAKELRAEAIKLGKGVNSKILVRFTN
jgi:hypothetical protein